MLSTFLVLLIVVPLVSAAAVAMLGPKRGDAVRWVSLGSTVLSLILAVVVAWDFAADRLQSETSEATEGFQPRYAVDWEVFPVGKDKGESIRFHIGLDGLNVWLIVLTALLMISAILESWTAIEERVNEYFAWMLALQMAMTGVFLAFDIILFYVFFELTLVPLFFLIGIWGGPQRQYAARKFFIYTLTGSLFTLLGVIGLILVFANVGYSVAEYEREVPGTEARRQLKEPVKELTFSIPRLVELSRKAIQEGEKAEKLVESGEALPPKEGVRGPDFWRRVQFWVFLGMMVGFAIKVPMVPVHTWLPLAHVEAPTAGSVLLAGVLLKIGTYGFLRLCLPLAPDASLVFAPWICGLAVVGIIYGAFCAMRQEDIKKLVAYSSVSHLGFCMLGLFAFNEPGIMGGLLQMINHGLSTGALFLLVGMMYERYHTRKIEDYGGMASRLKILSLLMVFITMSSIGLPGLNGFVGEVLVFMGIFSTQSEYTNQTVNGPLLTVLAATGVILGAWYMLTMIRRVFFGELKEPAHHHGDGPAPDLVPREIIALAPIAALCLFLGLYPNPVIRTAEPEVKFVVKITSEAQERHHKKTGSQAHKKDSVSTHAQAPVPNREIQQEP